MQEEKIARRYARALFESLNEDDDRRKVEEDLSLLSDCLVKEKRTFAELLLNPVFRDEERTKVLKALADKCKFSPVTVQFLLLLVSKKRLGLLSYIMTAYAREMDERLARARASIVSAVTLSKDDLDGIVQALQARVGKSVVADCHVDPDVLGGVRAQISGFVFDKTLKTQLETLQQKLISTSVH